MSRPLPQSASSLRSQADEQVARAKRQIDALLKKDDPLVPLSLVLFGVRYPITQDSLNRLTRALELAVAGIARTLNAKRLITLHSVLPDLARYITLPGSASGDAASGGPKGRSPRPAKPDSDSC